MQKKIIALAIASALTAPALAFADATVFGTANLSVDRVNDGNANSSSANQLNSNTTVLGVKGAEDLGNGMSAIWQMAGTVDLDNSNNRPFTFDKETFVGMSSASMGTLLAGRHDTPYKMATRNLDLFDGNIADNRGNQSTSPTFGNANMMGAGHDATLSNTLLYLSPSMSGFSVAAATVFGAESAGANASKGSLYSLAGMYAQGPIYATLAYDTIKFGSAGTGALGAGGTSVLGAGGTNGAVDDKATAFKVGGSYTMDAFMADAVIERITNTTAIGGVESKGTNLYLGGKFNVSSTDAVKAAITKRGSTTGATNDAKQYSVGYDHDMSKMTTVYALYTKLTDNTAGAADPSALSVGIRHGF
jgi:predicted porin